MGRRLDLMDDARTLPGIEPTGFPVTGHAHDRRRIVVTKDLTAPWRTSDALFFVGAHARPWLSSFIPGIHSRIAQDPVRSIRPAARPFVLLIFFVMPSVIHSCGPFLESAIFSFHDRPDGPREIFVVCEKHCPH
jgi:hypothetical protein